MDIWTISPDNSRAYFDVNYLIFMRMHGVFSQITGTASLSPDDLPHSHVEAVIDAASVTTGDTAKDATLHSPYFLDTALYPTITFRSTAMELSGSKHARITGDLTIRGITRQALLEADYTDPEEDAAKDRLTMKLTAKTTVDRNDYGITLDQAHDAGPLFVNREIQITLDVELVSSFPASRLHEMHAGGKR